MNVSFRGWVKFLALLVVTLINAVSVMAADIDSFDDKFIVKPFLQYPISQLMIRNYSGTLDTSQLDNYTLYQPNVNLNAGAGFSYKWIGLSIQAAVPGASLNEQDYGKSEYLDFQFYFVFKKFGFDLFFQRYAGFYLVKSNLTKLDNPQQYNIANGDPHIKRSDLKLTTIGVNGYYIFNDDFSFKAAFKNTERQNKSTGSFMLMASAINYSIEAEHSLIPPYQEAFYGENAGFSRGMFTALCILPGYAYTWVMPGKFYVTPAIFAGVGGMIKNYHVTADDKTESDTCWKVNVRIGIGYNGDSFFYGLNAMYDRTDSQGFIKDSGISVAVAAGQIEVFVGYRF